MATRGGVLTAVGGGHSGAGPGRAEPRAIHGRATGRVAQDLPGLVDAHHPLDGARVEGDVRMVFARQPLVGGLDHLVLGLRVHLEDLVRIGDAHGRTAGRSRPGDGAVVPRRRTRGAPRSRATAGFIRGRLPNVNPASDGSMGLLDTAPVLPREAVQRWRLVLARGALAPDAVGRELQAAWHGALASSGLPVAGLDSPMPRARFALGAPLAAAVPGEAELLDTWLVERLPAWRVREALARCLPAGWRLVEVYDVWLGEAPLPGRVAASVYRATFPAASGIAARDVSSAAERALAAPTLPRERHKGETIVSYDLRPFLHAI